MTQAEIITYVLGLTKRQLDCEVATKIMNWRVNNRLIPTVNGVSRHPEHYLVEAEGYMEHVILNCVGAWEPSTNSKQADTLVEMISKIATIGQMRIAGEGAGISTYWWNITPEMKTRAALIAHYINAWQPN